MFVDRDPPDCRVLAGESGEPLLLSALLTAISKSMVSLTRLRPVAEIVLWLGLVAVLVIFGLQAIGVTAWIPKAVSGNGFLEDNRQRVDSAFADYNEGAVNRADHLAAIIGISNVREDVDLGAVRAVVGSEWHLLGLGGAGLGIRDVAQHADVVLASPLRPDLVVLGISLYQLVDTKPISRQPQGILDYLRRRDFRNAAVAARDSVWLYSRRQDVGLAADAALLESRDRLFRRWGVVVSQSTRRSAWREMIKADWPDHFSAATLRDEEAFFEGSGVFESKSYTAAVSAPAVLVDMVHRFRDRGAVVVVLLMPHHSTMQRRIPAEAIDAVNGPLRAAFGKDAPVVLDFQNSVPDSGFVDLSHLNAEGRSEFSRLFAQSLKGHLPAGQPLMKGSVAEVASPRP
jgi:hypothetical protein